MQGSLKHGTLILTPRRLFDMHSAISSFSLQATQQHAQRSLARTALNLSDTLKAVDVLEQELQAAGLIYTQMQELKAYIADLCDMLQVGCCFFRWCLALYIC